VSSEIPSVARRRFVGETSPPRDKNVFGGRRIADVRSPALGALAEWSPIEIRKRGEDPESGADEQLLDLAGRELPVA
jgi:hypothetical protein